MNKRIFPQEIKNGAKKIKVDIESEELNHSIVIKQEISINDVPETEEIEHLDIKLENLHHSVDIKEEPSIDESQFDPGCGTQLCEQFQCEVCKQLFTNKQELQHHIMCKSFLCSICGRKFKICRSLQNHEQLHVDMKRFADNILHRKRKFLNIEKETLTDKKPIQCLTSNYKSARCVEKSFGCEICDFKCSNATSLKYHIMLTHGVPPQVVTFACKVCDYKTSNRANLKLHAETHSFRCKVCDFECKNLSILLNHDKVVHVDGKPFVCMVCDFKCPPKEQLEIHLRTHAGDKLFKCELCSFKSSNFPTLKFHSMKSHVGEKRFDWKICGFKCSPKEQLKFETENHPGAKLFKCESCDFQWTMIIKCQNVDEKRGN